MKRKIYVKAKIEFEVDTNVIEMNGYLNDNEIIEYIKDNYGDISKWGNEKLLKIDYEIVDDKWEIDDPEEDEDLYRGER